MLNRFPRSLPRTVSKNRAVHYLQLAATASRPVVKGSSDRAPYPVAPPVLLEAFQIGLAVAFILMAPLLAGLAFASMEVIH